MPYSYTKQMDVKDFTKTVSKFLILLKKYGYAQAIISSTITLKKDDVLLKYDDLTVQKLIDKLKDNKFIKGPVIIRHKAKKIILKRSPYNDNVFIDLDFDPSDELKEDIQTLFLKKKK